MHIPRRSKILLSAAIVVSAYLQLAIPQEKPAQPADTIACRVMEAHTSPELRVSTVVFHQRDKDEGPRLSSLLAQHSGASVECQTKDGVRHRAQVFRLKSCFGRGLLVFAADSARLAEKGGFLLRVP